MSFGQVCSLQHDDYALFSPRIQLFCQEVLLVNEQVRCVTHLHHRQDTFPPEVYRFETKARGSRCVQAIDAFARHFSGDSPRPSNVFERKGKICGELKTECQTLEIKGKML